MFVPHTTDMWGNLSSGRWNRCRERQFPEAVSVSVEERRMRRVTCRFHVSWSGGVRALHEVFGGISAGWLPQDDCSAGMVLLLEGRASQSVPVSDPVAAHSCFHRSFLTLSSRPCDCLSTEIQGKDELKACPRPPPPTTRIIPRVLGRRRHWRPPDAPYER